MPKINFCGLDIEVHRSKATGKLTIDVATHDLEEADSFENGVPKLIVYLNEERMETLADGSWKIGHD